MHYIHTNPHAGTCKRVHAQTVAKFLSGGSKVLLTSSLSPDCFAKDEVDVCNVTCAFPGLLFPSLCTYWPDSRTELSHAPLFIYPCPAWTTLIAPHASSARDTVGWHSKQSRRTFNPEDPPLPHTPLTPRPYKLERWPRDAWRPRETTAVGRAGKYRSEVYN